MLEIQKIKRDINWLIDQIRCLMNKSDLASPLSATEWSPNHSIATGNPYVLDCFVWLNGHVYKSLIDNNTYPPTNDTYWTDLGEGHLLLEELTDWNATTGRGILLNKPTNTSEFTNNGEDGSSPYATENYVSNAIPPTQDLESVLNEGDTANDKSVNVESVGLWDNYTAPFGFARVFADKSRIWFQSKLGVIMASIRANGIAFKTSIYEYSINVPNATGNRIATFQDASGVIAYLSDVAAGNLVATTWSPNHTSTTGNPYLAGTRVFYNGRVYQALFNNDAIIPTNMTYWLDLGIGNLIDQEKTVGVLPPGGTAGQILTKINVTDYNATWQDNYADWTSVVKHIVKNNGLNGTITKGTAVYVTSSNGTNMLVGKASNTSEATSSKTMGLMQSDITTTGGTQTGFVITEGLLSGLNTAGQTAGDPVWLGVNGALIYGLINKPYAPNHLVFIGIVTKVSAGNGEIFVKVQNGFELREIHDVDVITTTPINGHILGFNGTLWVNKTVAGWLGFTPVGVSYAVANVNSSSSTSAPSIPLSIVGGDILLPLYDAGVKTSDIAISSSMTINTTGTYEVTLNLSSWQVDSNQNLNWKIKRNGTTVASFTKRNSLNNNPDAFVGSAFISITAGQYLELTVRSLTGNTNLIFGPNTSNCTVNIKKIN